MGYECLKMVLPLTWQLNIAYTRRFAAGKTQVQTVGFNVWVFFIVIRILMITL